MKKKLFILPEGEVPDVDDVACVREHRREAVYHRLQGRIVRQEVGDDDGLFPGLLGVVIAGLTGNL